MKKVRLYESFHKMDEANRSEIHKAAKKGSYPVTIVITNKGGKFDGKVAHQETVDTPAAVPAAMKVLYKKYATWAHTFAVEDATGKVLFQEGLETEVSEISENYEVIFSDGISQMRKFRNERQALDFMRKEIKSNKKLRDIAVYEPGMHSTTQTELVVAFWGDGSYLDNVSKRDSKLAAKKLEESVVNEGLHPELKKAQKAIKRGKTVYGENIRFPGRFKIVELGNMYSTVDYEDGKGPMEMASMNIRIDSLQFESVFNEAKAFDKLNKIAKKEYGEFGFATLSTDEMSNHINMDMADELADKMFGEFGFASLSEDEMEKLINKNPKVVMESIESMDEKMVSAKRGHNYYKLYRDTPIKYISGKSGMGLEIPGVLLHNEYDTIKGQEGAYIIDYFGAHFYVDMENKFALKIVDPHDRKQDKDLVKNMGRAAIAPEHKDWKDFLNESLNEARSIKKIQDDYDKVVQKLLDTKESWKDCKASGDTKGEAKCLAELKELTAKKKALISELDDAIGLKDVSSELSESLNERRSWGTFGTPEAKKVIKLMDKSWDKFSKTVSKAHADFRSEVKSIINSEDGSKSGIVDSEGGSYITGMVNNFARKEFMMDDLGDISRYKYMIDLYESLVDVVDETIEEAKKDGTISDDEDERRAELLQKAKEQMEALLDTYEKEANDIGGKFRAPGIMAEIRKELEGQIKKFR